MRATDDPRTPDQAGKAARAEGAAAEAEHIDFVAIFVVEGEAQVGLDDIVFQPLAEHPAEHPVQPFAEAIEEAVLAQRIDVGADALAVNDDLRDRAAVGQRVRMRNAAGDDGDIGWLRLAQLLPRAVKTHDKTLHDRHPRYNPGTLAELHRPASRHLSMTTPPHGLSGPILVYAPYLNDLFPRDFA
jgi:hypothetical protein